jgi:predicted nucleic acid-binding protein
VTWLLDTNVLSELRKGPRADAGVRRWFDNAVDRDLFTSVLVAGELRRGVELIRRRGRPAGDGLAEWLITLLCSWPSAALCM